MPRSRRSWLDGLDRSGQVFAYEPFLRACRVIIRNNLSNLSNLSYRVDLERFYTLQM